MLKRLVFAGVVLGAPLCMSVGAWAEDRFALVIGNGNYEGVSALPNPVEDAKAVSELLEEAGFEVNLADDLGQKDLRTKVHEFAEEIAGKGEDSVALIYFAGHGVQIDGDNYLVPVDANIESEADVPLEATARSRPL